MKLRKEHKYAIFKELLDPMLKYFCVVTTALILVNWGCAWFSDNDWAFYSQDIVRVLLMAFFGVFTHAMITVFVETNTTKGVLAANVLRFVIIGMLVFGTLVIALPTEGNITLGTVAIFILIYAVVSVYSTKNAIILDLREKKLADDINQQLDEIHKAENETHTG